MKKLFLLCCLLPFSFLLFHGKKTIQYKPDVFYLGGIQIHEANNEDWVNNLKKAKMNTIEVTVYAKQGAWDSDSLHFDAPTQRTLDEIRAAKKGGMHVALLMRTHLDSSFAANKFIWHGMIRPKDEPTLARWFERYQAFILQWATIAEEEGVDVFGIGSEMNALSSTTQVRSMPPLYVYYNDKEGRKEYEGRAFEYEDSLFKKDLWVRDFENYTNLENYLDDRIQIHYDWAQTASYGSQSKRLKRVNKRRAQCLIAWKKLIKEVRGVYNGKLTYAANFDNYQEVAFWKQLDFIGINAYFSLRDANSTFQDSADLKAQLKRGWQNVFEDIEGYTNSQKLKDKPLIFTELGYISRENATIEPWAGFGFSVVGSRSEERLVRWQKEPKNWEERRLAMDALYEVVREEYINLEGLLYWKLTSHDYHMKHEPFALHLTPDAQDPLQTSLTRFSELDD
ncbi:MAG: glycoside hydrolase family 113 [Aureispira sp.]